MPQPPRESAGPNRGNARKRAAIVLAIAGGVALGVIVAYSALHRSSTALSNVAIGNNDRVYFTRVVTASDALALGRALELTGFFNDRGTSVLLSRGAQGTLISFVLSEGAWDHPLTVLSFEEIARRVAGALGGFPVMVRLCDAKWRVHKEVAVGKVTVGSRDEVYYYGAATAAQAEALGHALKSLGYLVDSGASVVLSKDAATTSIAFVVEDGAWNREAAVAGFQKLAREVAPAVGGPPIDLRLLNSSMEVRKEITGLR